MKILALVRHEKRPLGTRQISRQPSAPWFHSLPPFAFIDETVSEKISRIVVQRQGIAQNRIIDPLWIWYKCRRIQRLGKVCRLLSLVRQLLWRTLSDIHPQVMEVESWAMTIDDRGGEMGNDNANVDSRKVNDDRRMMDGDCERRGRTGGQWPGKVAQQQGRNHMLHDPVDGHK
ncbi:hypothetical protein OBBRIDRAFT_808609 [Obba rivulosa]|uniref:Uncharacterized protein n=1 Tax=Obba rivulosa TaxID=1052685 RepID=A0A8E2AGA7_9APHY|nr:hypothetical protein OBBRIDRAFT_808609 [Obba rivulosa]